MQWMSNLVRGLLQAKKRLVLVDQPNVVIDNITKGGHRERG
jgi:hypothetical protein